MRLFTQFLFPAVGLLVLTNAIVHAIEGPGEFYPSPNPGTITLDSGRWSNNQSFDNAGTLNNSDQGELINWSNRTLNNTGTLNNSNHGDLTNYGTLNNHGTLTNSGTLNNGGELVDIDFSAANIKSGHNKFKNAADSLHYEGVASYGGRMVDLVVDETTPSESQACSGSYGGVSPCTGSLSGHFGKIYMSRGNSNYYLDHLEFSFVYQDDGSPATLPAFYFSFLDLDNNEEIHVCDDAGLCGSTYSHVDYRDATKGLQLDGDGFLPTVAGYVRLKRNGNAQPNNPSASTDPLNLADVVERHAARFFFRNTSSFPVKLRGGPNKASNRCCQQIFFTGFTDLSTDAGTLNNSDHGELTNHGELANTGTLTNAGMLTNAGTLLNSGILNTLSGTFTNSGTIHGAGTVIGQLHDSGNMSPGNISPDNPVDVFTIDGNWIKTGGSQEVDLGGLFGGGGDKTQTEFDWVDVTGNVQLAGLLNVQLVDGFDLSHSMSFEIINVNGTLSGQFDGLGEGDLVGNFGGTDLYISYAGDDGNDVVLFSTIPEPTTVLLALLALAFVPLRNRCK